MNGEYVQLPDGSFTGNPGRSPDLQSLVNRLESHILWRTNLTRRAYQQTHEDVRQLYITILLNLSLPALYVEISVDYRPQQATCVNIMQFNAVARE